MVRFSQACDALDRVMKELEMIANEYKIRVIKPDLRAPASATFDQGHNLIRIVSK